MAYTWGWDESTSSIWQKLNLISMESYFVSKDETLI